MAAHREASVVGSLTLDGVVAPMTIDGAMNGATFLAYVEAPNTRAQRRRHPGQLTSPQTHCHSRSHWGRWRKHAFPAALQPRPQSS